MRHSRRLMSPCDADRHWTLAGCALCHGESKPGALGWLAVEIQSAEVFMIATKSPAPYLTTGVLERSHAGSGSTNDVLLVDVPAATLLGHPAAQQRGRWQGMFDVAVWLRAPAGLPEPLQARRVGERGTGAEWRGVEKG